MEVNDYVRFGKRKGTIVAINGNIVTVRPKHSKKFLELKMSKVTVIDYSEFNTPHKNPRPKKKDWPKAKTNKRKPVVIPEQERIQKTIVKAKYPNITEMKVSQRQMEVAERLDEKFCDEFKSMTEEAGKAYSFGIKFFFICILLVIGLVFALLKIRFF
jgi:hypothetical protein